MDCLKDFESPKLEIFLIDDSDVITTSGGELGDGGEKNTGDDPFQ